MTHETTYADRTDGVQKKLRLLEAARTAGNFDVAMSLAESIKDTLTLERQMQSAVHEPMIGAKDFAFVEELPAPWSKWARGWKYCKVVAFEEPVGIARRGEPVDLLVGFAVEQLTHGVNNNALVQRQIRVARVDEASGTLVEIPNQVYGETRRKGAAGVEELVCHVVFLADVPAHARTTYLIFYGNPNAELPEYQTDLKVRGQGFGLDIENDYYVAQLSRQMGQLERLTYKRAHGLELFAGGEGHGEPPNIDWAHDYLASNHFQKFRVTNWESCPNFEVVKGPLCVIVRRWGFPHSPVHPLFTPSRMHIDVAYTFYSGAPYFTKLGSMDAMKDFEINYLRDDEWVFSGYSFTDILWIDEEGRLHEGEAPPERQNNLWGVGFYNRFSRDAFIALWLEHKAENFGDTLYHCGAPILNYSGHGQLWSRWAAHDNPRFTAGTTLKQRNAYLVLPYAETDGAGIVEEYRQRFLNSLHVQSAEIPGDLKAAARGALTREGESDKALISKADLWQALREVKDEMLYTADANVVDMGYVYDVKVRGATVRVLMTMPHQGRPKFNFLGNPMRERLMKVRGVRDVFVACTWEPAWNANRMTVAGRKAMGME